MSSVAVLYKKKNTSEPMGVTNLSMDLHSNYWKIPLGRGKYNRFIDFGIKIYEAKDLESILLYVPFKDNDLKSRLSDLGEIITEKNFLSVLFNDDYEIHSDSITPAYKLAKNISNENKTFWIYELKASNFAVHTLPHGSLVEIKILTHPTIVKDVPVSTASESDNYSLYVRFRINNLQEGELNSLESVSNEAFQSFFSKSEMVNIHVNSIRELDEEDYQHLRAKYQFLNLNKCHFYFVGSSEEETVQGITTYKDCILLDIAKWKKYISTNNPKDRNCIAYHWTPEVNANHCHVFVKTVFSSTNGWKISLYILLMVILGATSSIIANNIPTIRESVSVLNSNDSTVNNN